MITPILYDFNGIKDLINYRLTTHCVMNRHHVKYYGVLKNAYK